MVCFTGVDRVEVQRRPMPAPGPGEVLIRTSHSLISTGTELLVLAGRGWSPLGTKLTELPHVGHCNAGTVVDVGDAVDRAWVGRRVATQGYHARFVTCAVAPSRDNWRSGVFAIPDGVSSADATVMSLAITAMHGLRRARLTWGESVAVAGLGLLGHLVVRLAAIAGATPIHGLSRSEERLAWLPRRPNIAGACVDLTRPSPRDPVDVVFETTGEPAAISGELALVRPGGRLVVLSSPGGSSSLDLHALCEVPSRSIIGVHVSSIPLHPTLDDPWALPAYVQLFFRYLVEQALVVSDLITFAVPGTDAADAYRMLARREQPVLTALLTWDGVARS